MPPHQSHPDLAKAALDALADEVAILDEDGVIVASNEAWRRFGEENDLRQEAGAGTDYFSAIGGDNEFAESALAGLEAVLDGDREEFELEYPCHSPNERRWFLMRARPLVDGEQRYLLVTHTDITQRRLAEEEVARKAAELAEDREQLALLNQVVRHDIRNEMQLALAALDRLRADGVESPALDHLAETTEHVVDLTEAIQQLSDIVTDDVETDVNPVALVPVLESEVDKLRNGRWVGVQSVTVTGLDDLPDVEVLATDLLSSVFGNLLSNGVLHSDRPDPHVDVSATVESETVTVTVADDGPGIPDDRKQEVLARGEKGLESPGSGVGLYLVDQLVDLYGGEVRIRDSDLGGTAVDVTLRRADTE